MIQEVIVTTKNACGSIHIAPMGIREEGGLIIIAPYKPSTTLDNIQSNKAAVINRIDDVRIFAGCLTGHRDWPLVDTDHVKGKRLQAALSHLELKLEYVEDSEQRPRCYCKTVHEGVHRPFRGFNRAQAAVLEAAILVSRLPMLSKERVAQELKYLSIAIDKTAGENEKVAWDWLMKKIQCFSEKQQQDKMA